MTQTTISRSVLHTSTVDFKRHYREYLKELAKDIDTNRVELITALEWCFDRWEYWRQKFYPEADLMFPFFLSMKGGKEFGHYSTLGPSGQPSVIHIKRSYLLGTSDTIVWKISPTQKLVLKKDHPDRLKYVDQTILHELVHQYLHEASPHAAEYESEGKNYGGHGPLFAAECNRINSMLHPELGFDFIPVRHKKPSHAKVADVQRPSCAQFTHGEIFWAWDPENEELAEWQLQENQQRLMQALEFFNRAVEVVNEAEEIESNFPAPFALDCAEVCIQQLMKRDQENGTTLLDAFIQGVLEHAGVSSAAPVNIPPAEGLQTELIPEPTVQLEVDSPLSLVEEGTVLDLKTAYPVEQPAVSLDRLSTDIKQSDLTKADFAQRVFGHKNGQQLSRHLKKLRELMAA